MCKIVVERMFIVVEYYHHVNNHHNWVSHMTNQYRTLSDKELIDKHDSMSNRIHDLCRERILNVRVYCLMAMIVISLTIASVYPKIAIIEAGVVFVFAMLIIAILWSLSSRKIQKIKREVVDIVEAMIDRISLLSVNDQVARDSSRVLTELLQKHFVDYQVTVENASVNASSRYNAIARVHFEHKDKSLHLDKAFYLSEKQAMVKWFKILYKISSFSTSDHTIDPQQMQQQALKWFFDSDMLTKTIRFNSMEQVNSEILNCVRAHATAVEYSEWEHN